MKIVTIVSRPLKAPEDKIHFLQDRMYRMWPFKKKEAINVQAISYSQVDITESFGDNLRLGLNDWIGTTPLNSMTENPESVGLPPLDANEIEIYRIASKMSAIRESIPIPSDGVYCPICHHANIDLGKLRTPCPKCERELLKFGWD